MSAARQSHRAEPDGIARSTDIPGLETCVPLDQLYDLDPETRAEELEERFRLVQELVLSRIRNKPESVVDEFLEDRRRGNI